MKTVASTKPSRHNAQDRFKQLGGMMIESLIGLLILSVVGGGVMHATARMTKTQQEQTVNNISMNQMRTMLMTRSSSTGGDLCTGTHSMAVPGATEPVALSVKGCGNAEFKITNLQTAGGPIEKNVNSLRPVVLEAGSNEKLVRVGGSEVKTIATP